MPAEPRPDLSVNGVSVAFGGVQALSNASIKVAASNVVGLIGPNGAGKTTLVNVIAGVVKPSAGTVHLGDLDITRLATRRRAALGVGRSFQNLGLMISETILTNLLAAQHLTTGYGNTDSLFRPARWRRREIEIEQRAMRAAEEFGLEDVLERRIEDLSFAKARLCELACVLVRDPVLVLLDEPTTGLDAGEAQILAAVVSRLKTAGLGVLIVAHDVSFVMSTCDSVYVLTEGKNLFEGSPQDVRSHPDVISAYLGRTG